MINITLNGRIKNKKLVQEFLERVAVELNIHRLRTKSIEINIKNKLDYNHYGECIGTSLDADIDIARNRYGRKISYKNILKTMIHEMVHAKQYLRGELHADKDTWMGHPVAKWDDLEYKKQPWEAEAIRLEHELYDKCWVKVNGQT